MVYKVVANIDQNMAWHSSVINANFTPNQYSQDWRYLLEWETLMNEVDWDVSLLWSNTSSSANLRLYGCNVSQWDDPYLELVPCYRKSDWVVWMYDLVNDVFYTNQWDWAFTKWPPVNMPYNKITNIYIGDSS